MEGSIKMEIVQETSRLPSLSSFWALGLGLAGEERGQVWKSEEMVLGLHPDLRQPGLEGRSESPKPVTHPEPLSMWEANGGVLAAPWQWQPLAQRQAGTICKHLT